MFSIIHSTKNILILRESTILVNLLIQRLFCQIGVKKWSSVLITFISIFIICYKLSIFFIFKVGESSIADSFLQGPCISWPESENVSFGICQFQQILNGIWSSYLRVCNQILLFWMSMNSTVKFSHLDVFRMVFVLLTNSPNGV